MTTLLLLRSVFAYAEDSGAELGEACPTSSISVDARYIEGACGFDSPQAWCLSQFDGPCPTLSERQANLSGGELFVCSARGDIGDVYYLCTTSWYRSEGYDWDGDLVAGSAGNMNGTRFCCEGRTGEYTFIVSESMCVGGHPLTDDPADSTDTSIPDDTVEGQKSGPCGCSTNKGVATSLLTALSLLTLRRRRQP